MLNPKLQFISLFNNILDEDIPALSGEYLEDLQPKDDLISLISLKEIESLFPYHVVSGKFQEIVNLIKIDVEDTDLSVKYTCHLQAGLKKDTLDFYIPKRNSLGLVYINGNYYVICDLIIPPLVTIKQINQSIFNIIILPSFQEDKETFILGNKETGMLSINTHLGTVNVNKDDLIKDPKLYVQEISLEVYERSFLNNLFKEEKVSKIITKEDEINIINQAFNNISIDDRDMNNCRVISANDTFYKENIILKLIKNKLGYSLRNFAILGNNCKYYCNSSMVQQQINSFFIGDSYLTQWVDINNELNVFSKDYKLYRTINDKFNSSERIPHDSEFGLIDGHATSQSGKIGVSVHRVFGSYIENGKIINPTDNILSPTMKIIPFIEHNKPNRTLLAHSNMRSSVKIIGNEIPKVCVQDSEGIPEPYGCNLLTGFMIADGWNYEDGILISQSAAKKMGFFKKYKHQIFSRISYPIVADCEGDDLKVGSVIKEGIVGWVKKESYSRLNEDEISNVFIEKEGEVLIGVKTKYPNSMISSIKHYTTIKNGFKTFVTEINSEKYIPLRIGDKLANRHANKGCISRILPDEEMPKTDTESYLDIVVTCVTAASRMNYGQILELSLANIAIEEGHDYVTVGQFENNSIKLEDLYESMKDRYKLVDKEHVIWNGVRTTNPCTIGYCFWMRLDKIVSEILDITDEPNKDHNGFKTNGQRLGYFEINALSAHGADNVLKWIRSQAEGDEILNEYMKMLKFQIS